MGMEDRLYARAEQIIEEQGETLDQLVAEMREAGQDVDVEMLALDMAAQETLEGEFDGLRV